jgi:hypothetical protein
MMDPESLQESIQQEEAPVDSEMLARIDAARTRPPCTGVPHEDVLREFGL